MSSVSFANQLAFTNNLNSLNRDHSLTDYIVDLAFQSMKGLNFLRQREMTEEIKGGLAATWTVNVGKSPNTVWYQGDQDLPINSMNSNIYTAALDWKFLDDALVVLLTDVIINDGSPDAVANAVAAQLDITKMSALQALANAWIQNNKNINPLAVDGLGGSIDNGTVVPTYAGLPLSAGAVGSLWQGNVNYAIAGFSTLLSGIQTLDISAQIDNSRPDFYMANRLVYGGVIGQLTSLDRYIQPDLARTTGSVDVSFNSAPFFIDSNVPTGVTPPGGGSSSGAMFGLNSRYLKLVGLEGLNWELEDWQKAQQNNTYFTRLHWGGNLVDLKPAAHWQAYVVGG